MFNINSMLPLLMAMNNKGEGGNTNMMNLLMSAMTGMGGMGKQSGNGFDIASIMSMMNGFNSKNEGSTPPTQAQAQTASTNTYQNPNNEQTSPRQNCREPRFWDSPARDANSIPPLYPNMRAKPQEQKQKPPENSGGFDMGMLSSLMGGNESLAPLLSMMGNKGGGNNNLMNMLPLIQMMSNNNQQKVKTNNVKSIPLSEIESVCPLDLRLKMNYYLTTK